MIYCKIGSSCPTIMPDDMMYTPQTNEVLMSSERINPSQVAKEDGTWITPPSTYTVYECVDGKLTIDVDSTYAKVEKAYEPQLTNIVRASANAAMAKANGTITDAQYTANFMALATKNATIFTEMIAVKEAAVNG